MRQATERGVYTVADVYPYLAGQTGLVAFTIPGWAQDGGREAMLKRFADPALRARIVAEAEAAMNARFGGPASVFLPAMKQDLTDVMRELQVPAGEAVVRLLERGSPGIIARFGIEADLVKLLALSVLVGGLRLRRWRPARPPIRAPTARSPGCSAATCASSERSPGRMPCAR